MLQNNVKKVASNMSNIFLTDMDTLLTFYFFIDNFDFINSPFAVLSLLKRTDQRNYSADSFVLSMFVFK